VIGRMIHATVSAGVAGCMDGTSTLERLLAAADQALYAAKQGGRNRVRCDRVTVRSAVAV
jgi:diguanylate cyclase (GGDEF)-like protein